MGEIPSVDGNCCRVVPRVRRFSIFDEPIRASRVNERLKIEAPEVEPQPPRTSQVNETGSGGNFNTLSAERTASGPLQLLRAQSEAVRSGEGNGKGSPPALQHFLAAFSQQCRAGSLWRDKDARVDPCVRCRSSLLGLGTGGPGLAQHGGDRPWRGAIRRAGA